MSLRFCLRKKCFRYNLQRSITFTSYISYNIWIKLTDFEKIISSLTAPFKYMSPKELSRLLLSLYCLAEGRWT